MNIAATNALAQFKSKHTITEQQEHAMMMYYTFVLRGVSSYTTDHYKDIDLLLAIHKQLDYASRQFPCKTDAGNVLFGSVRVFEQLCAEIFREYEKLLSRIHYINSIIFSDVKSVIDLDREADRLNSKYRTIISNAAKENAERWDAISYEMLPDGQREEKMNKLHANALEQNKIHDATCILRDFVHTIPYEQQEDIRNLLKVKL